MSLRPFHFNFILLIVIAVTSCAAAAIETQKRWKLNWSARAETYRTTISELEAGIRAKTEAFGRAKISAENQSEAVSTYRSLLQGDFDWAKANGQLLMLTDFSTMLDSKPTMRMASLWIVDRADQLNARLRDYQARQSAFAAELQKPMPVGSDWAARNLELTFEGGRLSGEVDELLRLDREFTAYVQDVQEAQLADKERRMKAAATLRGLGLALQATGQAMQQDAYQQQVLNALNRPVTCYTSGNMTTCD